MKSEWLFTGMSHSLWSNTCQSIEKDVLRITVKKIMMWCVYGRARNKNSWWATSTNCSLLCFDRRHVALCLTVICLKSFAWPHPLQHVFSWWSSFWWLSFNPFSINHLIWVFWTSFQHSVFGIRRFGDLSLRFRVSWFNPQVSIQFINSGHFFDVNFDQFNHMMNILMESLWELMTKIIFNSDFESDRNLHLIDLHELKF